jgi:Flp pilus assembly pilin Flp
VKNVQQFIREDEGQDVVEYGLLVATIGLVVLVGTAAFGNAISGWFGSLSTSITSHTGTT